MPPRYFTSSDRRFGVRINEAELAKIVHQCSHAALNETGGILVGCYSPSLDLAIVSSVSNAPKDSLAGGTWFKRGIAGLQSWLDQLWQSKSYYLGEWHFHPFAPATPSQCDSEEMSRIARTTSYDCPEPILLIIGGDPSAKWHVKVFVCIKGKGLYELREASGI